jgi:gliding motility-associated-like protein
MKIPGKILCIILLAIGLQSHAQNCPVNIGFEDGTFTGWSCMAGNVLSNGSLSLSNSGQLANRHVILANTLPQALDPYGNFPVNCPNGSGYSIRLGNSSSGAQAEQVSYDFTIPAGQNDYGIIYNYAVVIQNPTHNDYQQPRFTAKVFDATTNSYIDCSSFDFVASSNLPGFVPSPSGNSIFYKPWGSITIKLIGYAGHNMRLEFTTNDCTLGGHFGYAYLDVNENCSSPVSGNVVCNGTNSITLAAPLGFASYNWYTGNFSTLLGTNSTLTFTPPPAIGTVYAVEVIPYAGVGCRDTLYTTIKSSPQSFLLKLKDTVIGCGSEPVNLMLPSVSAGSSSGLTFSYFLNAAATDYLATPQAVTTAGTYYIKAVNQAGCTETKPIVVGFNQSPQLLITNPSAACFPATTNITLPSITAGSSSGINLSYWQNTTATIPLSNATNVDATGFYYIKATNALGCNDIKPVFVLIDTAPKLVINNPPASCTGVDITANAVTLGSSVGIAKTYFSDAAGTTVLNNPNSVEVGGTYFIKATNASGCETIKPVVVTISPKPIFTITAPAAVVLPTTANIVTTLPSDTSLVFSFWLNALATQPLTMPASIAVSGMYYIKAVNRFSCQTIVPVNVVVLPPATPIYTIPNAFSPNGDGINDVFKISAIGWISINHFTIYNRWGQRVYTTTDITKCWDGTQKGKPLPAGTYYWVLDITDDYAKEKVLQKGFVVLLR